MTSDKKSERFPSMPWHEVAEKVAKSTFRLYTSSSMGTGFLVSVAKAEGAFMAVIATAWHVVQDVEFDEVLKISDCDGKEIVRSDGGNIAVFQIGKELDSAIVIVQSPSELFSQDQLLPLLPVEYQLKTGAEIGWMGYPGFVEPELCFFHGYIAGMLRKPVVYLVDGVAINGVSGGPVFDDRCHLVGFVSAYLPNRVDDLTILPGVSFMVPINIILTWLHANMKPRDLYGKF